MRFEKSDQNHLSAWNVLFFVCRRRLLIPRSSAPTKSFSRTGKQGKANFPIDNILFRFLLFLSPFASFFAT